MSGHEVEPVAPVDYPQEDIDVLMVAKADELHTLTLEGWRLVESIPNASVVERVDVTMTPACTNDNGSWMSEIRGDQAFVIVKPLFILKKSIKAISRENELEARLLLARGEVYEANRAAENARRNFDDLTPRLKNLEEQVKLSETLRDNVRKDLRDKMDRVSALEKMLARIRKEVGEQQWRHLIGSHASCINCIERGDEVVDPLDSRVKGSGGT